MSNSLVRLNKELCNVMESVDQKALTFIEVSARRLLQKHPNLDEFVMAMGGWFFTRKIGTLDHFGRRVTEGNTIIHTGSCHTPKYIEKSSLSEFIYEWDDLLKMTGEPMRFTVDGPVKRSW